MVRKFKEKNRMNFNPLIQAYLMKFALIEQNKFLNVHALKYIVIRKHRTSFEKNIWFQKRFWYLNNYVKSSKEMLIAR